MQCRNVAEKQRIHIAATLGSPSSSPCSGTHPGGRSACTLRQPIQQFQREWVQLNLKDGSKELVELPPQAGTHLQRQRIAQQWPDEDGHLRFCKTVGDALTCKGTTIACVLIKAPLILELSVFFHVLSSVCALAFRALQQGKKWCGAHGWDDRSRQR